MFGRSARENVWVGVTERGNLRFRMIEVAAHIEIKYAPKADKTNAAPANVSRAAERSHSTMLAPLKAWD